MGLISDIKNDVKKSGQNKGKLFYVREGQKARVRFLQDMDDGLQFTFHDSYARGITAVCREHYGEDCPYCDDEDLRTRSQYCWSVWDYESKEVKLFLFPVNNCSPIPALLALHETYGTITDRDFVIGVTGKQQNKTYSVVPMDKVKFRNDKAKPFSESKVLKILKEAFPDGADDEEEDEKPKNKKGTKKASSKKPKEEDWDDEEEGTEEDYSEMTPKELYKLCKERNIDAEPKKSAKYYINLLEEWEKAQDDWDDEEEDDEDDDWEDDED